jgi:hypothetical protein
MEEARFFGMIKWNLDEKRLELIDYGASQDGTSLVTYFGWDKLGNQETETACREALDKFIASCGGQTESWALDQWKTCKDLHEEIWQAAITEWKSLPRILEEEP